MHVISGPREGEGGSLLQVQGQAGLQSVDRSTGGGAGKVNDRKKAKLKEIINWNSG